MYTDAEIVDMYVGVCDPSTTVAPTTEPTLINKCGDLPDVEVGFWTCHDTVCVLECAEGQIAHINLALQAPVSTEKLLLKPFSLVDDQECKDKAQ